MYREWYLEILEQCFTSRKKRKIDFNRNDLKVVDIARSQYCLNNFFVFTSMTLIYRWFCRELNAEPFGNKIQSETVNIERNIQEILRPPLILDHPLFALSFPSFYLVTHLVQPFFRFGCSIS